MERNGGGVNTLPESLALHLMDPAPTNFSCAHTVKCVTEMWMQRFKRARSKPSYTHPKKSCPLLGRVGRGPMHPHSGSQRCELQNSSSYSSSYYRYYNYSDPALTPLVVAVRVAPSCSNVLISPT